MAELLKPDLCIVGAGPGGLAAAFEAARHGAETVLVDPGGTYGAGLEDVSTDAFLSAGRLVGALRKAEGLGLPANSARVSMRSLEAHLRETAEAVAPLRQRERLAALGVRVLDGPASFADPRSLALAQSVIRPRRFILAPGAVPVVPDIAGLGDIAVFTPGTVLETTRKLTHLLVIGGGPTGLSLAQAFESFGSQVTVLDRDRCLARFDPELSSIALARLRASGIEIIETVSNIVINARSQGIGVDIDAPGGARRLDVSHVLLAAGDRLDLGALALDKARIRLDPQTGRIETSTGLTTTNGRVMLVGQADAGLAAPHLAAWQARRAVEAALFGTAVPESAAAVPRVAFTDPEIAQIGLTEAEARGRWKDGYRMFRAAFADNPHAHAIGRPEGLARLVCDPSGKIVGAGIVGVSASELLGPVALAMARGLKPDALADMATPAPSLASTLVRLGEAYRDAGPKNPWRERRQRVQRLMP